MAKAADVIWLEFPGAVQTKRRPAVVLSSAAYHASRPDVIVGLITSQVDKIGGPTDHLLQDWKAAGLRLPSAFRAYVVTVAKTAVISTVGALSSNDWKAVAACVRTAIRRRSSKGVTVEPIEKSVVEG